MRVLQDAAVVEQHALGRAGRAAGVDDAEVVLGADWWRASGGFAAASRSELRVGRGVDVEDREVEALAGLVRELGVLVLGDEQARLGVREDRL